MCICTNNENLAFTTLEKIYRSKYYRVYTFTKANKQMYSTASQTLFNELYQF